MRWRLSWVYFHAVLSPGGARWLWVWLMFFHWLLFEESTDKGVDFGENELAVEGWHETRGKWKGSDCSVICSFCVVFLKSHYHHFYLIFDCQKVCYLVNKISTAGSNSDAAVVKLDNTYGRMHWMLMEKLKDLEDLLIRSFQVEHASFRRGCGGSSCSPFLGCPATAGSALWSRRNGVVLIPYLSYNQRKTRVPYLSSQVLPVFCCASSRKSQRCLDSLCFSFFWEEAW